MNTLTQLQELQAVLTRFADQLPLVEQTGRAIAAAFQGGHTLFTCGNGGSATDAMHLAEELTGRYKDNRRALPALCLNGDASALTCIANDFGYEAVFARQIEAFGKPGDVLVAFSTSGHSPNVLRALAAARESRLTTILVGGKDGGRAAGNSDFAIIVPSDSTARIQEVHTFILHQWLEQIEADLFHSAGSGTDL